MFSILDPPDTIRGQPSLLLNDPADVLNSTTLRDNQAAAASGQPLNIEWTPLDLSKATGQEGYPIESTAYTNDCMHAINHLP